MFTKYLLASYFLCIFVRVGSTETVINTRREVLPGTLAGEGEPA
jgi:hypothetical protein